MVGAAAKRALEPAERLAHLGEPLVGLGLGALADPLGVGLRFGDERPRPLLGLGDDRLRALLGLGQGSTHPPGQILHSFSASMAQTVARPAPLSRRRRFCEPSGARGASS